jgi:hypothetical protein
MLDNYHSDLIRIYDSIINSADLGSKSAMTSTCACSGKEANPIQFEIIALSLFSHTTDRQTLCLALRWLKQPRRIVCQPLDLLRRPHGEPLDIWTPFPGLLSTLN